jgi:hypothetical protein
MSATKPLGWLFPWTLSRLACGVVVNVADFKYFESRSGKTFFISFYIHAGICMQVILILFISNKIEIPVIWNYEFYILTTTTSCPVKMPVKKSSLGGITVVSAVKKFDLARAFNCLNLGRPSNFQTHLFWAFFAGANIMRAILWGLPQKNVDTRCH